MGKNIKSVLVTYFVFETAAAALTRINTVKPLWTLTSTNGQFDYHARGTLLFNGPELLRKLLCLHERRPLLCINVMHLLICYEVEGKGLEKLKP